MFMAVVYPFQGYTVHSLCDSGVGGLAPMAELAPPSPMKQLSGTSLQSTPPPFPDNKEITNTFRKDLLYA